MSGKSSMIVYAKCRCGNKLLLKRLESEGHEIRLVNKNATWRKKAKSYGLKMPFVVEDGQARPL